MSYYKKNNIDITTLPPAEGQTREVQLANLAMLVDFDKNHIPTKTVFLNQNYRSTPQILQCANSLIEKNKFRLKKDLFTQNGDGEPVFHFHMKNEYAEADKIIETIQSVKKTTNCDFADFAALALLVVSAVSGNLKKIRQYRLKDYLIMIAIGLPGSFLYYVFYYKLPAFCHHARPLRGLCSQY